jgi:UPF0755 protein
MEVLSGMSVRDIATQAKNTGLVKSEGLLYFVLSYFHDPTTIYAGQYLFVEPVSVFGVADKLASSNIEDDSIALTFPEGIRVNEMAGIASTTLQNFDTAQYLALSADKEGRLFPETYFVPNDYSAAKLIDLQEKTFLENLAPFLLAHPEADATSTIIIASILEREANSPESMGLVAGVFQNRIELDMALQADATIEYTLDVPLNKLAPGELAKNLREVESPYNTYLNPGLPPTPIGNPGLDAITAVLNPTETEYFYYITGNDGEFYYAETYNQHLQNIARYLR